MNKSIRSYITAIGVYCYWTKTREKHGNTGLVLCCCWFAMIPWTCFITFTNNIWGRDGWGRSCLDRKMYRSSKTDCQLSKCLVSLRWSVPGQGTGHRVWDRDFCSMSECPCSSPGCTLGYSLLLLCTVGHSGGGFGDWVPVSHWETWFEFLVSTCPGHGWDPWALEAFAGLMQ